MGSNPGLGPDFVLSAASAQIAQTLFKKFFEFGACAALEQHVPVTTRDFHVRTVDLDWLVAHQECRRLATRLALPAFGRLGFG